MRKLNEKDKIEICNLYKEEGKTIQEISKNFKIGDRRVKSILLENGITISCPTKKVIDDGWNYNEELRKRYPPKNGFHYEAIEKNTGKRFKDYLNSSGALTSYIKEMGIEVPSLYKRTTFFKKNGYQWYEQWFDIIQVENTEISKKCPYCNWETIDVENKSGAFLNHIIKEHGITKEKYLLEHPEDKEYLRLANKTLDLQTETDAKKFVTCAICGKKLSRIDWHHLLKHGITKKEYVEKYGDRTVSDSLREFGKKRAEQTNLNAKKSYTSKAEKEILSFLESNDVFCEKNRSVLHGKEIDIFIPQKNIGIEYDGLRWHSEWRGKKSPFFHASKTNECKKNGIKLIHIFEDEFVHKKNIVFNKIGHIIGLQYDLPKIMGRKCTISEVGVEDAKNFLNRYHIQGWVGSTISYGAFFNGKLIAIMSFKKRNTEKNIWELTRFASDYNFVCQGVGGKLFKRFVSEHDPSEIISFADRRWTINEDKNVYTILGFENDGYTKPSYTYINDKVGRCQRFHKFGFRKDRIIAKYGDKYELTKDMTESEMAKKIGFDRIWDCGLIRYVWKKETDA